MRAERGERVGAARGAAWGRGGKGEGGRGQRAIVYQPRAGSAGAGVGGGERRPTAGYVVTLLTADERLRVEAVSEGRCDAVHRETLEEVAREVRRRPVAAVVLSVRALGRLGRRDGLLIAEVTREFPAVPVVALVCEADAGMPEAVLALGRCGVRRVVDVRQPTGWGALRAVLAPDPLTSIGQEAIARVTADLAGAGPECVRFFRALFEAPAHVTTVRTLAQELGVLPTTLMSRFFRARLPAPKRYLWALATDLAGGRNS